MRAVLSTAFGDPSSVVIAERTAVHPREGEVRIAVRAIGVNFIDTLQVAGQFQIPAPFPFSPGFELAGEVVSVGPGVAEVAVEDRVLAVTVYGAYAEEVVLPVTHVVRLPDGMDFPTGAAFPVAYATAHVSLCHRGRLRSGETLVVYGASGNVGAAAVEIGTRVGATVIAVVGDPDQLTARPDHVIAYRQEDVAGRVKALTAGRGADLILDLVGGGLFAAALDCIAWEGRILTVGYASGTIPDVSLVDLLVRNIAILGEDLAGYITRDIGTVKRALTELIGWYDEGALRPRAPRILPFEEAAAALAAVATHTAGGKLVLTTADGRSRTA